MRKTTNSSKRNKIIAAVFTVCVILLTGCSNVTDDSIEPLVIIEESTESVVPVCENIGVGYCELEVIGETEFYDYLRETVTDVLYLKYKGGYAGGLTVMLDPETGLPLTYERYMEIYTSLLPNEQILN